VIVHSQNRRGRPATPGRRDHILDTALALFAERGFHGTSIPDLAAAAGIAPGSIYRHVASKEQLVNEVYRRAKALLAAALYGAVPAAATAPLREQFRALWWALVGFARAEPRAFAFLELHHHGDYLDGESVGLQAQLHQRFVDLIQTLQAARALRGDVDPDVIIAVFEGVFMRMRHEADRSADGLDARLLEQAERCIWEAVRA
jgi:AcrR family transcriptional regulator